MDERKIKILKAIIEEYIETAEPVGSRYLSKRIDLGLSSATIRNEMSDLEEMGYLVQPHTSAGRIPTEMAYKFYVKHLLKGSEINNDYEVNLAKNEMINFHIEDKINELNEVIRQASALISKLTNYTSVAVSPQMGKWTIKAVQIVPIGANQALVVVVLNNGTIRNRMVDFDKTIPPEYFVKISNTISERVRGLTLGNFNKDLVESIENNLGIPTDISIPILEGIMYCIAQMEKTEVFTEGATNIFSQPEFRDVSKAEAFLQVLNEKDKLIDMFEIDEHNSDMDIEEGLYVRIGSENEIEEMNRCSFLTATYSIGDEVIGKIGIIGPTRMNYAKAVSALRTVRNKVNAELKYLLSEDKNES